MPTATAKPGSQLLSPPHGDLDRFPIAVATRSIDAVTLRNNAALISNAARIFNVSVIPTTVAEKSFSGPGAVRTRPRIRSLCGRRCMLRRRAVLRRFSIPQRSQIEVWYAFGPKPKANSAPLSIGGLGDEVERNDESPRLPQPEHGRIPSGVEAVSSRTVKLQPNMRRRGGSDAKVRPS